MTISVQQLQRSMPNPALPWWRVGALWLAFGGLAVVMVGSVSMAVVAIAGADTVLAEGQVRIRPGQAPSADTPALVARNHAATAATEPKAAQPAAERRP
jgi:uncharacterized protein